VIANLVDVTPSRLLILNLPPLFFLTTNNFFELIVKRVFGLMAKTKKNNMTSEAQNAAFLQKDLCYDVTTYPFLRGRLYGTAQISSPLLRSPTILCRWSTAETERTTLPMHTALFTDGTSTGT
jgi:hypothetical protein